MGIRCSIMRQILAIVLFLVIPGFTQESAHKHGGSSRPRETGATANRFGTVQFKTSCDPAVASDFDGAVALLHSFEYDEARAAFVAVQSKDPKCAMASWGESMSDFHGLWGEYNATEGAKAAATARRIAADNSKTTDREKRYIAAISGVFSDEAIRSTLREDNKPDGSGYSQPSREAEVKYTQSMAELHKQFPDDREATIFYALALNISAKRSDKTHADLKQCTALLYPLFAEMPNHPGVAHYIIHCNDNPEMAKYGLEAARKYAQIAPDSTHATHMPSHIFAQMGLWNEMVESNQVSLRAAEENPNAMSCEKVGNALHAMSFLVVALPQSGRMQEAQGVLEHSQSIKPAAATGDRCNDDGKSEVLAAYMIETGDWKRAKELKIKEGYSSPLMGTVWMAVGIGAVQAGDMAQADTAERQLAAMRDARSKLPGQSMDNGLEALRLALAGWRAEQAGEKVVAEQDLRKAADLQDRLDSNYVIIKPVREMLADLLLLNGNQAGALAEYRAVLILQPNRFNSVYGAGTAALRAGDMVTAKVYYTQLLGLAGGDERPELGAARSKMAENVSAATP
jgi:tetratricopeptide (TPR) repeat protein